VSARGIQATHRVQIGAGKLQVDAIIAPQVDIATHASGRVTIIECQNELGPNALKGKLRLADYQETFGDPAAYLAERGLTVPGETSAVEIVEAPRALEAVAAPVVEEVAVVEEPAAEEAPVEAPAAEEAHAEEPAAEEAEAAPAEASEAVTMDVEIEESEDAAMGSSVPAALPAAHPLHGDLVVAVAKIVDCYADAEVPPAVSHLQGLINAHAYEQVRAEITTIWTDLLKFHHKKGLRIQHQVTTTFNTINSLVKKM
jgi:hypothetical protein